MTKDILKSFWINNCFEIHKIFNKKEKTTEFWVKSKIDEISITLRDHSHFIDQLYTIIRNKEISLHKPSPIIDKTDYQVRDSIPKAILTKYVPYRTPPLGSCFYDALSLILFNDIKYSPIIRLITFDKFFEKQVAFVKFIGCQLEIDFNRFLLEISTLDECCDQIISEWPGFNNWASTTSIIATHLAIQRPIIIYSNFIQPPHSDPKIILPGVGEFKKTIAVNNVEKLAQQFRSGDPSIIYCGNRIDTLLWPNKRPICLFLEFNHFTALVPRSFDDPFIPMSRTPTEQTTQYFTSNDDSDHEMSD